MFPRIDLPRKIVVKNDPKCEIRVGKRFAGENSCNSLAEIDLPLGAVAFLIGRNTG